ncbi:hypothetical protein [Tenacibaculum finnmarkense]|nr:hypothetical protein [Tenacibaculum finnmarkense]MBE7697285.1 hypothetical protein [Tenacibaculum finnmarkense genomovar ulcerans]
MNNLIKKATYISVLVVCAYFMKPEKVDAGVAGWDFNRGTGEWIENHQTQRGYCRGSWWHSTCIGTR